MPEQGFSPLYLPFYGGMPAAMQNMKYVPIVGANLGTTDTDLYTVPTGRAACINGQIRAYNPSAGSITYYIEAKIGGVYYELVTATTLTTLTGGNIAGQQCIVLNAGESLSVNTITTAGLNVRLGAFEFDASDTRLATSRNLALASGDNTLYTVPTGKSAVLVGPGPQSPAGNNVMVTVVNHTGGSLNYYVNIVPSGSSVGSTNQLYPATTVANQTSSSGSFNVPSMLAAGDFISVNSSGADAGSHQIAWVTYYQLP